MIERFFGAINYERLYRVDIDTSLHERIGMTRPLDRYQQTPSTNIPDPESVPEA